MNTSKTSMVGDKTGPAATSKSPAQPHGASDSLDRRLGSYASACPDAIALEGPWGQVSYGELWRRSRLLSTDLGNRGVGPEDVVGLFFHPGPESVVATLAVLSAGGALLALDPDLPQPRLRALLAQSRARGLLCTPEMAEPLAGSVDWVSSSEGWPMCYSHQASAASPHHKTRAAGNNLSHVALTSGSSGIPKLIQCSRDAVGHYLDDLRSLGLPRAGEASLHSARPGFDVFLRDLLAPLAGGGRVVFTHREQLLEPTELIQALRRFRLSCLPGMVPYQLGELLQQLKREQQSLAGLRLVLCAGEAMSPREAVNAARWLPAARLVNLYGPTECTGTTTSYVTAAATRPGAADPSSGQSRWVPIGQPNPSSRLRVFDHRLQPVKDQDPGEALIGGPGLARGYRDRPAATATAFVPDPEAGGCPEVEPGARLYRSGDQVRRGTDACLHFVGRLDHQLKIRGVRIEPGEVEAALLRLPGVKQATVVQHRQASHQPLVAYVVSEGRQGQIAAALRQQLARVLPLYLVPSQILPLARMPRLANGKLDRRGLERGLYTSLASHCHREQITQLPPASDATQETVATDAPMRDRLESDLLRFWAEVLEGQPPDLDEDLYQRGAQSLTLLRVLARLRRIRGIEARPAELLAHATVRQQARALWRSSGLAKNRGSGLEQEDSAEPNLSAAQRRLARAPLSSGQQRLWLIHQLSPDSSVYHVLELHWLAGQLCVPALRRACHQLVVRHPSLRTRYGETDGEPWQQELTPSCSELQPALSQVDLSGLKRRVRSAELRALIGTWRDRPFALDQGKLLRALLITLRTGEAPRHLLGLCLHHIATDDGSQALLRRDLGQLYAENPVGERDAPPKAACYYRGYAQWERERSRSAWARRALHRRARVLEHLHADHPQGTAADAAVHSNRAQLEPVAAASCEQIVPASVLRALELGGHWQEARATSPLGRTTLFMVLAAAWSTLLARLASHPARSPVANAAPEEGRRSRSPSDAALLQQRSAAPAPDLLMGFAASARDLPELESLVGFFVHTLMLRLRPRPELSFSSYLARVRHRVLTAYEDRAADFAGLSHTLAELPAAHGPGGSMAPQLASQAARQKAQPPFQAFLVLEEASSPLRLPGVKVRSLDPYPVHAKFPLTLYARPGSRGLRLRLCWAEASFAASTMQQHLGALARVLEAVARVGSLRIDALTELAFAGQHESKPRPSRTDSTPGKRGTDRPTAVAVTPHPRELATKPLAEAPAWLWQLWQELLPVAPTAHDQDFFSLGGHSLLAMRLMARLRQRSGKDLPAALPFEHPTLAGMAAALETRQALEQHRELETHGAKQTTTRAVSSAPRGPRQRPGGDDLPASSAQRRMLFLERLWPGNPAYHMSAAFDLHGPLQRAALQGAVRASSWLHESLCSALRLQGEQPRLQLVHPSCLSVLQVDLSGLEPGAPGRAGSEARRVALNLALAPFDLSRAPLLRCALIRFGNTRHQLHLVLHHAIADQQSREVLYRDLGSLYQRLVHGQTRLELKPFPWQLSALARWQQDRLQQQREKHLAFWRQALGPQLPGSALPADRPTPSIPPSRGEVTRWHFPPSLATQLQALARRETVSLFMVFYSLLATLLGRASGQHRVVLGCPFAQPGPVDLSKVVGLFVNLLPLSVDLRDCGTFQKLLQRTRQLVQGAVEHQELPFDELVRALSPPRHAGRHPLFSASLSVVAQQQRPELKLTGLRCTPLPAAFQSVRLGLELHVEIAENDPDAQHPRRQGSLAHTEGKADSSPTIRLTWRHDARQLDQTTVLRLRDQLQGLALAFVRDAQQSLFEPPLLNPGQQHQVLHEWNDRPGSEPSRSGGSKTAWPTRSMAAWLQRRVQSCPEAVAVQLGLHQLSYAELWLRAQYLAQALSCRGVGPEQAVAVLLAPGPERVVALLALLLRGAPYLALDPALPLARLGNMCSSSGVRRVLTDKRHAQQLAATSMERLVLDGRAGICDAPELVSDPTASAWTEPIDGQQLAYSICTSGSTGLPKAVAVSHQALVHHMDWMHRELPIHAADRVLLRTPVSFDASVWELWGPLLAGARLVVAGAEAGGRASRLGKLLEQHRITCLQLVPSLLRELLHSADPRSLASLRILFCGGESLHPELRNQFFRQTCLHLADEPELINLYGPAEATIHASFERCRPEGPVTLGRSIARTRLLVLDRHLRLQAPGMPGELGISGPGLARGYRGKPANTAEAFVPAPFSRRAGQRLYRTGDRVRMLADGRCQFLGRMDQQLKLRGNRVEPAEIEALLRQQPEVEEAAVVLAGPSSEPYLCAFVQLSASHADTPFATEGSEATAERGEEQEHLLHWQRLYGELYAELIETAPQPRQSPTKRSAVTKAADHAPPCELLDTTGWISSYNGQAIPRREMEEWLQDSLRRVRSLVSMNERPRVLEIGCGTGMLLLQLAPQCQSYVGTDISEEVLNTLQTKVDRTASSQGWQARQVELYPQRADDFSGLEDRTFDLVLMHSVVQYFPSAEYLLRVMRDAVSRLAPGGTLLLGDLRNLGLQEAFCASVALGQAPPSSELAAVARRARRQQMQEKELLIRPSLVARWLQEGALPGVSQLLLWPRRGSHGNEMNRFRFDLALRREAKTAPTAEPVILSWQEVQRDGAAALGDRLAKMIVQDEEQLLWVRGLPDPRCTGAQVVAERLGMQADTAPQARPKGRVAELLRELAAMNLQADGNSLAASPGPANTEPDHHDPETPHPGQVSTWLDAILPTAQRELAHADARLAPSSRPGTFELLIWTGQGSIPSPDHASWHGDSEGSLPSRALASEPLASLRRNRRVERWQQHLREHLPAALVPTRLEILHRLPTNLQGKVDRAALRQAAVEQLAQERPLSVDSAELPQGPTEQLVARVWSECLGFRHSGGTTAAPGDSRSHALGRHEDFFALGGHSLMVARVMDLLGAALGQELPLRGLFQHPTVAGLAAWLEQCRAPRLLTGAEPPLHLDSTAPDGQDDVALSPIQSGLWIAAQLLPDSSAYTASRAWRLIGPLQVGAFNAATGHIVQRHPVLRSRFPAQQGKPSVVVERASAPAALAVVDLSKLDARSRESSTRHWVRDLAIRLPSVERGPLFRAVVFREQDREHTFFLQAHHLVFDGESESIFRSELTNAYAAIAAGRAPALPILATDFNTWAGTQRKKATAAELQQRLQARSRGLGTLPPLNLPVDRPRPREATHRAARASFGISSSAAAALMSFGQQRGASPTMTLLALFAAWLSRLCQQRRLGIGLASSHRHGKQLQGLIGPMVNLLVVDVDLRSDLQEPEKTDLIDELDGKPDAHRSAPDTKAAEQDGAQLSQPAHRLPEQDPSFDQLLALSRRSALHAYADQDLSFESLVRSLGGNRSAAQHPLVQCALNLLSDPPALELSGVQAQELDLSTRGIALDLELRLRHSVEQPLRGELLASLGLFEHSTVRRLGRQFQFLLQGAARLAQRGQLGSCRLAQLPMLSQVEQQQLREWSDGGAAPWPRGAESPVDADLLGGLQRSWERRSDSIAALQGRHHLSYQGLEIWTRHLARQLRARGVGPEVTVALSAGAELEGLGAQVAVLLSGGCLLPLEAGEPRTHQTDKARSAGAELLMLPEARLAGTRLVGTRRDETRRDEAWPMGLACLPLARPAVHPKQRTNHSKGPGRNDELHEGVALDRCQVEELPGQALAYLLHTSGSSGKPRPVAVSRAVLGQHLRCMARALDLGPSDRVLARAGIGFDVSFEQRLLPLTVGATVLLQAGRPWAAEDLDWHLGRLRPTVMNLPPAYWDSLSPPHADARRKPKDGFSPRLMVVGGDVMTTSALARWRRGTLGRVPLCNAYGPTEAVITATLCNLGPTGDRPVPSGGRPETADPSGAPSSRQIRPGRIDQGQVSFHGAVSLGRPLTGRDLWIVDPDLHRVLPGSVGEICLGGLLARGYHRSPRLSALRFVPHPFAADSGLRLLRTGDRARHWADGQIQFLGRLDRQVKIRGLRVEPGAVETVLRKLDGVRDAVVLSRADRRGEPQLVAYVQGEPGQIVEQLIRSEVELRLPRSHRPARYLLLRKLPRTPRGKVDLEALPEHLEPTNGARSPSLDTALEREIAGIWSRVLGLTPAVSRTLDPHCSFFDLGGHSLRLLEVRAALHQQLGLALPVSDLFQFPTVHSLAKHLERSSPSAPGRGTELPGSNESQGSSARGTSLLDPSQGRRQARRRLTRLQAVRDRRKPPALSRRRP